MPDWVKSNIPTIIMFVVGTYVGLQTLETKFTYQELRAEERYRLLVGIQKTVESNTKQLTYLEGGYKELDTRLMKVENYIPQSLVNIEKDVISIKKDITMLSYQMNRDKT